jgi:hypothetical protein
VRLLLALVALLAAGAAAAETTGAVWADVLVVVAGIWTAWEVTA